MNKGIDPKRVRDLMRLLTEQNERYRRLLQLVQGRTDAMKRADLEAMTSAREREMTLAGQIQEQEGLRRQMMDAIGKQLDLPAHRVRAMTASQLAEYLDESRKQALLVTVASLRETMAKVARANRVAGQIARGVLGHFQAVFSSATNIGTQQVGYSGKGAIVGETRSRLIETTG